MTEEGCDRILEAIASGDFAAMFQAVTYTDGDLTPEQRQDFLKLLELPKRNSFDPETADVFLNLHLACPGWMNNEEYLMLAPLGRHLMPFVEVFEKRNEH